jgi:hypothetical protein
MPRNLSSLAASILHARLLEFGPEHTTGAEEEPAVRERGTSVRRNAEYPRQTDKTPAQPHRPRGHGA